MNFTLSAIAASSSSPLGLQVPDRLVRARSARVFQALGFQGSGATFAHRFLGPVHGRGILDAKKAGGCIVVSGTGMFFV